MTLDQFKRAAELLPPGSTIALAREAIIAMATDAESKHQPGAAASPPMPLRLLTAEEVATRLGISRKHVYARAKNWPFTRRLGSKLLRFDEAGLERWLARRA